MQLFPFSALTPPASTDEFVEQIQAVCREAGGDRFLVVRLCGSDLEEVLQVVHNGGHAVEERLGVARHWSVDRMLEAMRATRVPIVFGPNATPGLEVDGLVFGIGAIARSDDGACVAYFSTRKPVDLQGDVVTIMASAHIAAQHGVQYLSGKARRECPFTKQELSCMLSFAAGNSNRETAAALGISVKTVENHLERVRIKCGVDSTLAASVMAFKEGWMSWPEVRASWRTG